LAVAVIVVISIGAYNGYRNGRVKAAQPCWGHLVNIEAAKEQWAIETGAKIGAPVTIQDIQPYLRFMYSGAMPTCNIAGGTYIIGNVGEEPRCTVHGTVSHFKPDRY
jgi:hypothetical protein